MSRVVVLGATGKQGGAVAELLLERGHDVIAYVRSPQSPRAHALQRKGARLAGGDLADARALAQASAGAEAIFGLSVPCAQGGEQEEIRQGRLLIDTAAAHGLHLVYSSVRGADRLVDSTVAHASSKQQIEAYLRGKDLPATVLGPTYFMENALNVEFNQLRHGVFAMPLSPGTRLDQVTVIDIAAMAVHALENPGRMAGKRIDLASDSLTGDQAAAILSEVLGREIPYRQLPLDQVRAWAGEQVATMFARFEANTDFVDVAALRTEYPDVAWHSFTDWARTVDWDHIIATTTH